MKAEKKKQESALSKSLKAAIMGLAFVGIGGFTVQSIEDSNTVSAVDAAASQAWSVDDYARNGWYSPSFDGFCQKVKQEIPDIYCKAGKSRYVVGWQPIKGLMLADDTGKWKTLEVPSSFLTGSWKGKGSNCFVADQEGECAVPDMEQRLVY